VRALRQPDERKPTEIGAIALSSLLGCSHASLGEAADPAPRAGVAATVRAMAVFVGLERDARSRAWRSCLDTLVGRQLAAGQHGHARLRTLLVRGRRRAQLGR
jgi:hypothetical protein